MKNNNRKVAASTLLLTSLALLPLTLYAKGEVTQINTHREAAPSTTYTANGDTYTWQGDNLIIDSFVFAGNTYNYDAEADNVIVQRSDNTVSTGEKCAVFTEAAAVASTTILPEYPRLSGTNNCDMATIMGGKVINRGTLDVFNNGGGGRLNTAKNIERVDYIFSGGITAPFDATKLSSTGVAVTEKHGDNNVLVAVILSLDASGQPASYSKPIYIHTNGLGTATKYSYGMTNITYLLSFLNNELTPVQGYPYIEDTNSAFPEILGMTFVDLEAFELTAGQVWYGFSYFSPDVGDGSAANVLGQTNWKAGINPVDYANFPLNTSHNSAYGDADIYGGVAGYFVDDSLNNITGIAYKDDNQNNIKDMSEEGLAKIKVTLYQDTNSNGQLETATDTELATLNTDSTGAYSFIGLNNGDYLLVIDENDSDAPTTHNLYGNNPLTITINNADSSNNDFPYSPTPKLSASKTVSPPVAAPGATLVYTLTVKNNGIVDATEVEAVDILPDNITYVSDDSGGAYNVVTGLWTVGTINAGSSAILNITVKVN